MPEETNDVDLEKIQAQVEAVIEALDPDERVEVLGVLLERFCAVCGEEVEPDAVHECEAALYDEDYEEDEEDVEPHAFCRVQVRGNEVKLLSYSGFQSVAREAPGMYRCHMVEGLAAEDGSFHVRTVDDGAGESCSVEHISDEVKIVRTKDGKDHDLEIVFIANDDEDDLDEGDEEDDEEDDEEKEA